MVISKEKLQTLQNLFKEVNGGLTKREFVQSFEVVVKQILELEKKLIKKLDERTDTVENLLKQHAESLKDLETQHSEAIAKIKEDNEAGISTFKRLVVERVTGLFAKSGVDKKIREIDDRLLSVRDGEDGKDADEEAIVEKLKAMIPAVPEIGGIEKDVEEIKAEHDNIYKEIEELKARPVGRGGGTSAIGVAQTFKYIAHTEAPTGDIDGVNTTYTVSKDIWWIAGFTINGEQVAELPNFTYSGRTITFTTAIPAVYSGKDFEVKYIG